MDNCLGDCHPLCHDGLCNLQYDPPVCPEDCATCGNNFCDNGPDQFNGCGFECACGNGHCDVQVMETPANCPQDCTACNFNGFCEPGETTQACPKDCFCGNGFCQAGETTFTCPKDCGFCNNNLFCEFNETPGQCPKDCFCGNGQCEATENTVNCPQDCGFCNNNLVCEFNESPAACPKDCFCGNGQCEIQWVSRPSAVRSTARLVTSTVSARRRERERLPLGLLLRQRPMRDAIRRDAEQLSPRLRSTLQQQRVCDPGESAFACPKDCTCGNGRCENPYDFINGCAPSALACAQRQVRLPRRLLARCFTKDCPFSGACQ